MSSPSQITVSAPRGDDDVAQLLRLARADVGGRVGLVAALDQAVEHLRAGGLGEPGQLGQRVLGVGQGAVGPHADEHDALEAQLPVLDLGDVGELGGQAGDAAQRLALLEVVVAGAARRSGVGEVRLR